MLVIQTLPASVSAEGKHKKRGKIGGAGGITNPEEIHGTGTQGEEKGIQNEESFSLTKRQIPK